MPVPWRRDRIRTCRACGEEWRVPRALARRFRPSRWREGIRPAESRLAGSAGYAIDVQADLSDAKRRSEGAERERELVAQLRQCPKCGATDYDER